MVDFLDYPSTPADHSFGRFPDAGAELRIFPLVTPAQANDVPPSRLILNEYNAVSDTRKLDNLGSDVYWGRVDANGGNWFELVVAVDHLDIRGWRLHLTDDPGVAETTYDLTFSSHPIWADLRAGTIVTVSDQLDDDTVYDPLLGDWWLNAHAASDASGSLITPIDFEVSNRNWQLTIFDASDLPVFGPSGEGVQPLAGIGGDEVFKLEEDPSPFVTPVANYNDGTSSTFGEPNVFGAGAFSQDFTALREIGFDRSVPGRGWRPGWILRLAG